MTIKKYQGKTKEEAIDLAKAELGPRAVIMNVKEVHPSGFLGVFRKSTYEVTAAIEDEFAPAEREVFRGRDEVVDALRDAVLESSPQGADEGGKASEANPENTNDEKKEEGAAGAGRAESERKAEPGLADGSGGIRDSGVPGIHVAGT